MKCIKKITVVFFAVFLFFSGCGYTTDSLIRDDITDVYIGYFENDTRRHGLEVDLRRALSQEVKLHGRLKLAGRDNADSIIEGKLIDYSISAITRTTEGDILMKRITVEVEYRWLDGLSGRELVPAQRLRRRVFLPVGHQEGEAEQAFSEIAQSLIQSLEREW